MPHLASIVAMLVTALVVTVAAPAPVRACDKVAIADPFTMFDQAATVALVRAEAPRGRRKVKDLYRGDVTVRVEAIVKGPPVTTLVVKLDGSSCDGSLRVGSRVLVLLTADGHLVEGYEGALSARAPWPQLLGRWGALRDGRDRAAFLIDLIAAGGRPGVAAATALAEHPDALAALTADQIAGLVALVPRVSALSQLPLALARVHAPGLIAAIDGRDRGPDHARTLIWGDTARPLAPVTAFEAVTDPAALADAITAARDPMRAVAAFDRCERVRGQRLDGFQLYLGRGDFADDWARAAAACRTGTPVR